MAASGDIPAGAQAAPRLKNLKKHRIDVRFALKERGLEPYFSKNEGYRIKP